MNEASQGLRIIVVDDEMPARNRLKDLLADCSARLPIAVVGEAANGLEALQYLDNNDVDVILSDIRMPEMDGIELAQHLLKLEDPPHIIFTTAYDTYAIRAFELHAIDYLLKPIRLGRLFEALSRARTITPLPLDVLRNIALQPRANLSVQERGKVHLIPMEDILYLKAELKYVTVKTLNREHILEESLINLEEEFAQSFVRIHRNCLVAKKHIIGFERIPMMPTNPTGSWC